MIETASGKLLPDSIERTRAASLAGKYDNSGFFYTRYPKKGDVPEGQEVYNRHVFYHALGADSAKDPLIFGEGRNPEWWPDVTLSEDGRWLLIDEGQGWTKTEMFLKDLTSTNPPLEITTGKNFLYGADFFAWCSLHAFKLFGGLAAILALAILVLWAFYGFRYSARPPGLHLGPDLATSVRGLKPFEAQVLPLLCPLSPAPGELSLRFRRRETDEQRHAHIHLGQGL